MAQAQPELHILGDRVIEPRVLEWIADAETNLPYVQQQDVFGHPLNKLVTSEGWKSLKALSIREGIVAIPYEREFKGSSRCIAFAKNSIFTPSAAMTLCPAAMTDGVAKLAELFGPFEETGDEVYKRLTSRDPSYAWTSGQWMTERPGGSDVSNSETVATRSDQGEHQYLINGFKWFSSATDSEVCALLAKADGDKKLSCFIGKIETKNGKVQINRLKKKFGTHALPTAELQLNDLPAEMVGPRGRGTATISTVLNITRMYSAVGSVGYTRRAFHIAREYSLIRSVFGRKLCNIPAHVKILASIEAQFRGFMFLNFYTARILGENEFNQSKGLKPEGTQAKFEEQLLRVLPGVCKATSCKAAVPAISECMEALGGVGYLEHDVDTNIARLMRDAQVNAIWEGTTNTLADDFARHIIKHGTALVGAVDWFLDEKLNNNVDEKTPPAPTYEVPRQLQPNSAASPDNFLDKLRDQTKASWLRLREPFLAVANKKEKPTVLTSSARDYIFEFGRICISSLLISDASQALSKKNDEISAVAVECAARWVLDDLARSATAAVPVTYYEEYKSVVPEVWINDLIVYGQPMASAAAAKL